MIYLHLNNYQTSLKKPTIFDDVKAKESVIKE